MKTVVQFGAGNIGRGFLGQLYSRSGWSTVYVDVRPEVIDALNGRGGFDINIVGPGERVVAVENVRAVDGRDIDAVAAAVDEADLLGTAVGVNALPHIVGPLCRGLERRAARDAGVDMIICENLLESSTFLRERILEEIDPGAADFVREQLGLVETVVSRMIPVVTEEQRARDPLYVGVEAYGVLPVARAGFVNGVPEIEGFDVIDDIHAYEERKLFCHNCMHALASYFGFPEGYEYVWQAVGDPAVVARVRAGAWESGLALMEKHGFSKEQHHEHIEDLLTRFSNRALGDTVARCGGDPVRKLGRRDRLVGAALPALEYGVRPVNLVEGICAAVRFSPPDDPSAPQVAATLERGGIDAVIEEICGLAADEPLAEMIRHAWSTQPSS